MLDSPLPLKLSQTNSTARLGLRQRLKLDSDAFIVALLIENQSQMGLIELKATLGLCDLIIDGIHILIDTQTQNLVFSLNWFNAMEMSDLMIVEPRMILPWSLSSSVDAFLMFRPSNRIGWAWMCAVDTQLRFSNRHACLRVVRGSVR